MAYFLADKVGDEYGSHANVDGYRISIGDIAYTARTGQEMRGFQGPFNSGN